MKKRFVLLFGCAAMLLLSCSKKSDIPVTPPVVPPVVPPVTPTGLTKQNVKTYMVDAAATNETVALFYNLKTLSKTSFVIGQQDAFDAFHNNEGGMSDIKKVTGSDPGLLGLDFIFITDKNNTGESSNWFYQQEVKTVNYAKEAYKKGMINIFTWHIREPYKDSVFYATDMSATDAAKAFKSILPGGENHDWYKKKLDKVASVFNNLKGDGGELIPVIFRPFHEYDGSWFWWGANFCTAEEYKTAYQFTVDYLKNTKNVHNVLYALGPDNSYDTKDKYLSRYPGDGYVDILGMDNYGDFGNGKGQAGANTANLKLKVISDLAIAKVKIAALTETGYQVTASNPPITGWFSNYVYSAVAANNTEVAFVMFWGNGGGTGGMNYFVPGPSASNKQDFIDFAAKPKALLQNKLPKMYVIPQ